MREPPVYYMCDFETTVYTGQERTDVWAAAIVQLYTEDVVIYGSIDSFLEHIFNLQGDLICYFHNLKFDGAFIINYLLHQSEWEQAYIQNGDLASGEFKRTNEMVNNTYKYVISDMGQWYSITLKHNDRTIEFRDSYKLLPFSVKSIGNSFGTAHKKLDMEYKGLRYPNCYISEEEKEYIRNDVLVVKEAIEIALDEGHKKLTIGACCLEEFKKEYAYVVYKDMFPNLYQHTISALEGMTMDEFVRKSYRGGWCYVVPEKANKVINRHGITLDVNSLYPSMMHSESGNYFPVGVGCYERHLLSTKFELDRLLSIPYSEDYYFIHFKCRFYIKEGMLPTVQIKNNVCYYGREWLKTSDVYDRKTGKYCRQWIDQLGELHEAIVELTMTRTDFELFLEHYYVTDLELIDSLHFEAEKGIFDEYIDHWKEVKLNSKGAKRTLAKLFLNNLYGKMAASMNSSFKVAYLKEDGSNGFYTVYDSQKKPGYIPVGSAITSYARNFTIRAAQKNYHGPNKAGFIYADTDSIHCDTTIKQIKGVKIHDKNFCCWKCESEWDKAIFVRPKTYIEHNIIEDGEPLETPYYNVKCAGMPDVCKRKFVDTIEGRYPSPDELDEDNKQFYYEYINGEYIPIKREMQDFTYGISVPGKLTPVQYPGGVVLEDTWFEMRRGR